MGMGSWLGGGVLVGALALGGAYVSKPSRSDHMDAIKDACREEGGALGAMGCGFALGAGDLFGAIRVEDHGLYTQLLAGDEVLSTGAFGTVWLAEGAGERSGGRGQGAPAGD